MKRYSVLMSVYQNDNPAYLKEALESIYEKQTQKPDEIIVVLDGPLTDELNDVLSFFAEDKQDVVRYISNPRNCGLGEALRVGAKQCTGDYIFRMDSDDICDRYRFETQIEYLEKHPEIDVLGADIAEFQFSVNEPMRFRECPEKHEAIVEMGKYRTPMNHVSTCIKRTALEKSGGYQTLLFMEDYYLWVRMIHEGCLFANIHKPLVYVRTGNGFYHRRKSREIVNSRKKIVKYMLDKGMVSIPEAVINIAATWIMVHTPMRIKIFIYDNALRKREHL